MTLPTHQRYSSLELLTQRGLLIQLHRKLWFCVFHFVCGNYSCSNHSLSLSDGEVRIVQDCRPYRRGPLHANGREADDECLTNCHMSARNA